jgi:hypothetical protein
LDAVAIAAWISSHAYAQSLPVTEVVLESPMHAAHREPPTYNYETLYALIRSYFPDFVGVAIRAEDIHAEDSCLKRNYPREMIAVLIAYRDKLFGIGWLRAGIVVVMGTDHRTFALENIKNRFFDSVKLLPVVDL